MKLRLLLFTVLLSNAAFSQDYRSFINKNIKYPAQARKMNIEGSVYAQFSFDDSGKIIRINLIKDPGGDCGTEVKRVLLSVPPNLFRSLYTKTRQSEFILPVFFGLDKIWQEKQPLIPGSDVPFLDEIMVLAGGVTVVKRELSGGNRFNSQAVTEPQTHHDLFTAAKNPKSVRRLSLQGNGLNSFPMHIMLFPKLEFLDLEKNKLQELPPEIETLKKLEELYLFENQLTSLPDNFGNLKELKILGLGYNQLKIFPVSITRLEQLETLDLSANQLTAIPAEIGAMKDLRELVLVNNQITRIPEELYTLKKLKKIYLQGNPIDPKDKALLQKQFKNAEIAF